MPPKLLAISATIAALAVAPAVVVTAHAAAAPNSYTSCKALNRDYPHGVGKQGARDKTTDPPRVTNFTRNNKLYAYNDGKAPRHTREHDLDRDNDGISCEQH